MILQQKLWSAAASSASPSVSFSILNLIRRLLFVYMLVKAIGRASDLNMTENFDAIDRVYFRLLVTFVMGISLNFVLILLITYLLAAR